MKKINFVIIAYLTVSVASASKLIVGGQKAKRGEYLYNISVRNAEGLHFCGGTLVDSRIVLTAAHCLDHSMSLGYVVIGANQLSDKTAEKIKITNVVIHEKWNIKNNDHDLALLILEKKSKNKPVLINESFQYDKTYTDLATIIGFGLTKEQGQLSNDLLYAKVPLVKTAVCKSVYNNFLTENMFCAGFSYGGVDSCQTDSGGGLFYDNQLIGVISWGIGCARPGFYGVYAKTKHISKWILETKKKISF